MKWKGLWYIADYCLSVGNSIGEEEKTFLFGVLEDWQGNTRELASSLVRPSV
jgi:hypothetical protein